MDDIAKVRAFLKSNDIPCNKYNYAMDKDVQNFSSFDAVISISEDLE